MRARYSAYFLNHVLLLQDELATYYVQDRFSIGDDFLGVELKTFFDHREAVEWLIDCVSYDNSGIRNLRYFLDESAPHSYALYRWEDYEVMDEAARVIMDDDYPVVISPIFEPLKQHPEIIDVICYIQNSELQPIPKGKKSSEIFQLRYVGEYTYDENIALNILKLLPNTANNIWNIGVDAVNIVLHDVQYISQKGGRQYLKARLNTELNWSKETAEALSDLVKDGPRQVMDFLTAPDMKAVKDSFKSVLYAKNWEDALAIGLSIVLTKKLNRGLGSGVKTTGRRSGAGGPAKAPKSKPAPQQKLKPVEIKTAEQESFEFEQRLGELRTGQKTITTSKKSKEILESKPDSRQTPQEYWDEYYSEVGNKGDNIDDLKKSLDKRDIQVQEGSQASYKDNKVTYAKDTKRWEVKEEYLHSKVEKEGWKKSEIKSLRKELRNRRIKQPARVAEEITVKEYMLDKPKSFGLKEADVKLLEKQVRQLKLRGLQDGY